MNEKAYQRRKAHVESLHPKKPLKNTQAGVPGQQLGLYRDATSSNVRRMVSMMNNPSEPGQRERG